MADTAYELFVEIELVTYHHLQSIGSKDFDITTVHDVACSDIDVLRIWAICAIDIETTDKQMSVLLDIVKEWTKLRGHSIASMELEKYKKTKSDLTKKKSLRKDLRQLSDK